MTQQRSGDDRRLAGQKQEALTGGNTNYYLTALHDTAGTVVETEDVIELLKMEFHLATTFKSTDRLCKLRMGLGKPGSTPKYEIGKIVYYNQRADAVSLRRTNVLGRFTGLVGVLRDIVDRPSKDVVNNVILKVTDPKRLPPYSFRVGDFIDALKPSTTERRILENTFTLAIMRKDRLIPRHNEILISAIGVELANRLQKLFDMGDYQ
jgi:hypothetical protein